MAAYRTYYADGAYTPSSGSSGYTVIDPTSEQAFGEVQFCSRQDIDAAVTSAQRGFAVWRGVSLEDRREALKRLHAALSARTEEVTQSLAREIGCPVWLGGLMQVPMALKGIEFAIEGISCITWTERIGNGLVERVPAGVVAAITPWNFPVHQIVAKVAAALAAGCSVVLKPSEIAPGAAMAFMDAVHEADIPAGVVNMVWGDPEISSYLTTHPGIDRVSFTGSTSVGQRIMESAAARLTPVTLELGGKSAAVILDDADLSQAIPVIARLGLANSGQACVSQSRVIVPRRLLDDVVFAFRQAFKVWPKGDPTAAETRLGPLATSSQFTHVCRMAAHARAQGARLVAGGDAWPGRGYYVSPTLFADVTPDMELAQREVFGPVIALMTYESEAEAVDLANATRHGLSGAVWSKDAGKATAFAQEMRTGQVVINGAAQNLATPFGGWGLSGFGRENGRFGIEDLLNFRSLHGAS